MRDYLERKSPLRLFLEKKILFCIMFLVQDRAYMILFNFESPLRLFLEKKILLCIMFLVQDRAYMILFNFEWPMANYYSVMSYRAGCLKPKTV
jgi:hypothetical protein